MAPITRATFRFHEGKKRLARKKLRCGLYFKKNVAVSDLLAETPVQETAGPTCIITDLVDSMEIEPQIDQQIDALKNALIDSYQKNHDARQVNNSEQIRSSTATIAQISTEIQSVDPTNATRIIQTAKDQADGQILVSKISQFFNDNLIRDNGDWGVTISLDPTSELPIYAINLPDVQTGENPVIETLFRKYTIFLMLKASKIIDQSIVFDRDTVLPPLTVANLKRFNELIVQTTEFKTQISTLFHGIDLSVNFGKKPLNDLHNQDFRTLEPAEFLNKCHISHDLYRQFIQSSIGAYEVTFIDSCCITTHDEMVYSLFKKYYTDLGLKDAHGKPKNFVFENSQLKTTPYTSNINIDHMKALGRLFDRLVLIAMNHPVIEIARNFANSLPDNQTYDEFETTLNEWNSGTFAERWGRHKQSPEFNTSIPVKSIWNHFFTTTLTREFVSNAVHEELNTQNAPRNLMSQWIDVKIDSLMKLANDIPQNTDPSINPTNFTHWLNAFAEAVMINAGQLKSYEQIDDFFLHTMATAISRTHTVNPAVVYARRPDNNGPERTERLYGARTPEGTPREKFTHLFGILKTTPFYETLSDAGKQSIDTMIEKINAGLEMRLGTGSANPGHLHRTLIHFETLVDLLKHFAPSVQSQYGLLSAQLIGADWVGCNEGLANKITTLATIASPDIRDGLLTTIKLGLIREAQKKYYPSHNEDAMAVSELIAHLATPLGLPPQTSYSRPSGSILGNCRAYIDKKMPEALFHAVYDKIKSDLEQALMENNPIPVLSELGISTEELDQFFNETKWGDWNRVKLMLQLPFWVMRYMKNQQWIVFPNSALMSQDINYGVRWVQELVSLPSPAQGAAFSTAPPRASQPHPNQQTRDDTWSSGAQRRDRSRSPQPSRMTRSRS